MENIFLVGFMGCGKTTIAQYLSAHLGYICLDMDTYIIEYTRQSIAHIFAQHGESYFRHIESACLHHIVGHHQRTVVATGGGTPCFFDNITLINRHHISIYLETPPDVLCQRLWQARTDRPLLQNITNEAALLRFISQKMSEREPFYRQATYTLPYCVDDDMQSIVQKIENVIFCLSLRQNSVDEPTKHGK